MKICLLNNIKAESVNSVLGEFELVGLDGQPDYILVRSHKLHNVEIPSSVQAIARAGAGVDNIPLDQCRQKGIVVFNAPGANANAVRELTLCALIMSCRHVSE